MPTDRGKRSGPGRALPRSPGQSASPVLRSSTPQCASCPSVDRSATVARSRRAVKSGSGRNPEDLRTSLNGAEKAASWLALSDHRCGNRDAADGIEDAGLVALSTIQAQSGRGEHGASRGVALILRRHGQELLRVGVPPVDRRAGRRAAAASCRRGMARVSSPHLCATRPTFKSA